MFDGRVRVGRRTLQGPSDEQEAAGAALTSFMTKCERDMTTACDMQASERKNSEPQRQASRRNASMRPSVGN